MMAVMTAALWATLKALTTADATAGLLVTLAVMWVADSVGCLASYSAAQTVGV
jgi:hypothetical protein